MARWRALRRAAGAVHAGIVPALVHLGQRAPARQGEPAAAGGAGPPGGAAARRRRARVHRCRLDPAAGVRARQAGRGVRPHQDPGQDGAGPRPERARRHDQHAAGRAGDRRCPAARRECLLRAGRGQPHHRGRRHGAGRRVRRDRRRADGLGLLQRRACAAARRAGAFFSVTARLDPAVKAAIAAIGEDAWTPVRYPRAAWDDQQGRWISDAQVAQTSYTAFTSVKGKAITARLIVRRVRDLSTSAQAAGQGELFPAWRYHAVFTDSPFTLLQAEEQHRDHAVIEQVFADLTERAARPRPLRPVRRQRRLARPRRDHAQPDPRRRHPRLQHPRQGERRDDPPRPDRRRRPHRPARPRPPHPAPARRLAPRARMDEPVRCRVRPARPRRLTSRTRSPRFARPSAPAPNPPTANPGQPARTASGKTSTPARSFKITSNRRCPEKISRYLVGGSRLSTELFFIHLQ